MNPERCHFLAQDQPVEIIPRLNHGVLHLIQGDVGPIEAGVPITVPLWFAFQLRRKSLCKIVPPVWFDVEELKRLVQRETTTDTLQELPDQIFEISYLLVWEAKEDIMSGGQVKSLIKDLWDRREAKLRTSSLRFVAQHETAYAQMDNLQLFEAASPCVRGTVQVAQHIADFVISSQDYQD